MPKTSQAKRPPAHEWSLSSCLGQFRTLIKWLPVLLLLFLLIPDRTQKEEWRFIRESLRSKWQLNVTLICCLPWAQLTPSLSPTPRLLSIFKYWHPTLSYEMTTIDWFSTKLKYSSVQQIYKMKYENSKKKKKINDNPTSRLGCSKTSYWIMSDTPSLDFLK